MGKRSRDSSKTPKDKDNANSMTSGKVLSLPSTKHKRAVDVVEVEVDVTSKQKKSKKNKPTLQSEQNESCIMSDEITANTTENKPKKSKRNELPQESNEPSADEIQDKVKKINNKVHDSVPEIVSVKKSGNNKHKKTKQNANEDEEGMDDGEIDKFCDELSEQDNALYEQWIKLLEAKLKPNKNT